MSAANVTDDDLLQPDEGEEEVGEDVEMSEQERQGLLRADSRSSQAAEDDDMTLELEINDEDRLSNQGDVGEAVEQQDEAGEGDDDEQGLGPPPSSSLSPFRPRASRGRQPQPWGYRPPNGQGQFRPRYTYTHYESRPQPTTAPQPPGADLRRSLQARKRSYPTGSGAASSGFFNSTLRSCGPLSLSRAEAIPVDIYAQPRGRLKEYQGLDDSLDSGEDDDDDVVVERVVARPGRMTPLPIAVKEEGDEEEAKADDSDDEIEILSAHIVPKEEPPLPEATEATSPPPETEMAAAPHPGLTADDAERVARAVAALCKVESPATAEETTVQQEVVRRPVEPGLFARAYELRAAEAGDGLEEEDDDEVVVLNESLPADKKPKTELDALAAAVEVIDLDDSDADCEVVEVIEVKVEEEEEEVNVPKYQKNVIDPDWKPPTDSTGRPVGLTIEQLKRGRLDQIRTERPSFNPMLFKGNINLPRFQRAIHYQMRMQAANTSPHPLHPAAPHGGDPQTKVVLRNAPPAATEDALRSRFLAHGELRGFRFFEARRTAVALFVNARDAADCVASMDMRRDPESGEYLRARRCAPRQQLQ